MFLPGLLDIKTETIERESRTGKSHPWIPRDDSASYIGYWSTHTKPSHTRVNSPHFWSTHPIYEIKKDYSEGAYGI